MLAQKPSFATSWRQLTRDKGWIKPLLVLTLVGWIPIVGQIAILGYALEWARLTAWGVDAAPKQGKVGYGKVMRTGFVALLVMVSMGLVLAIIDVILFGTASAAFSAFPMTSFFSAVLYRTAAVLPVLVFVVNVLFGIFILVAMMRATIYDSFSAGWRLDRIFEMIGKDVAGFFRIYLVSIIGGVISGIYFAIVGFVTTILIIGATMGATMSTVATFPTAGGIATDRFMFEAILQMGAGMAIVLAIIGVVLLFIGGVIGTAVQLISINAVGQWFSRFDVQRWGTSSAPLPEGGLLPVSGDPAAAAPAQPAAPVQPVSPAQPAAPVPPVDSAPVAPAGAAAPAQPVAEQIDEDVIKPYQPDDGVGSEQAAPVGAVPADPVGIEADPDPAPSADAGEDAPEAAVDGEGPGSEAPAGEGAPSDSGSL